MQAERAGKIISRIREFVKRSEPRRQSVKVHAGHTVENAVGVRRNRRPQAAVSSIVLRISGDRPQRAWPTPS
jgi:hypothetical protein